MTAQEGAHPIEWDGHLVTKLLKRLSFKQCLEYLMNGYIKTHSTKLQYSIYPFAVQQMSIRYLGHSFFIRFKSSFTDKTKIKLLNEHTAMVIKPQSIYYRSDFVATSLLIDLPIPVQDKKIKLKWNIKINALTIPNGHYFIGIVSDRFPAFDDSVWMQAHQKKIVYGVFGNPLLKDGCLMNSIIWNGDNSFYGHLLESHSHRFKIGNSNFQSDDIVTIEYDGKLKQLKIYKQHSNELICEFYLKSASSRIRYYYPAVSLKDAGDYVQIV